MKTDWLEGEVFRYCTNKDNIERGTLADKIPLGGKYIVEYVYNDCVTSDGLVFYFDEIKPVMQVKGELIWKHLNY